MKELIGHIESLLLMNDCVIVPEFGGFIAFNIPAKWMEENHSFVPPLRTVGFNPRLKLNDGLVVQAYMSAYGTNFPDASKRVHKATRELKRHLMNNGVIELLGLGTLRVAMDGSYHFVPFVDGLNSPALYGLGELNLASFVPERNIVRENPNDSARIHPASSVRIEEPQEAAKDRQEVEVESFSEPARSRGTAWRIAVASAAAVALFLSLSTPVGNVEDVPRHRAQVVALGKLAGQTPGGQTGTAEKAAVLVLPELANSDSVRMRENKKEEEAVGEPANVSLAKPTNGAQKTGVAEVAGNRDTYFVIVGAFSKENSAEAAVAVLHKEGYPKACVISNPRIHKVCIASYTDEEEAVQALRRFRGEKYEDAWVFKNK